MDARVLRYKNVSGKNWINLSIGRSGFYLNAKVNSFNSCISVALNIKNPKTKSAYEQLAVDKEKIETELGAELEWRELQDKSTSIISLSLEDSDLSQQQDWQRQFEWLAVNLEQLDKVFRKRIKALPM